MSTDVETREASLLLNIFFVFVFVAKVAAGFSGSCGLWSFGGLGFLEAGGLVRWCCHGRRASWGFRSLWMGWDPVRYCFYSCRSISSLYPIRQYPS
jgi:hypothetical protein